MLWQLVKKINSSPIDLQLWLWMTAEQSKLIRHFFCIFSNQWKVKLTLFIGKAYCDCSAKSMRWSAANNGHNCSTLKINWKLFQQFCKAVKPAVDALNLIVFRTFRQKLPSVSSPFYGQKQKLTVLIISRTSRM